MVRAARCVALCVVVASVLMTGQAHAAQREIEPLDRGWTHVVLGGDEATDDSSRWTRIDLPFATLDPRERIVLRRELRAPASQRERRARVRLSAASEVAEAFLDGVALRVEERGFDVILELGSDLSDGERHELLVLFGSGEGDLATVTGVPTGIAGGARIEYLGERFLELRNDRETPPLVWSWLDSEAPVLELTVEVVERLPGAEPPSLRAVLLGEDRAELASAETVVSPDTTAPTPVSLALAAPNIVPWTPADPRVYGVVVELSRAGEVVDRWSTTTAPRRPRDGGYVGGSYQVGYDPACLEPALSDSPLARLSARALRRDAVRLGQLGAAVWMNAASVADEALLVECDLRGIEVAVVASEAFPVGRRRALEALAQAHPSAVIVNEPPLDRDGLRTLFDRFGPTRADRSAAGSDRREHARLFVEAARTATSSSLVPDALEMDGGGTFTSDRLPTWAYHRLRAASGQPTAYAAVDWAELELGGELTVYSSGDAVEVFVDGESLGRRRPWRGVATFERAPSAAEQVLVRSWRGGTVHAERVLLRPGAPAQILLLADELGIPLSAIEHDQIWVHALVLDGQGTVCTDFDGEVVVSLLGGGEIVGSGRPRAEGGVASVVLRATGPDPIQLAASATAVDERLDSNRLTVVPDGF
ncbi:hypothetical protein Pla86_06190 [Planctomycetes bacterium Pla86]|uniref:Uncharacterized protein n=3 Tax=Engelhardtia mirabilis TaxID=2528011 RepID=A0A518BEZ6_9BACT|nr:hypothetical protein Pla133_06200 [Planctomycetes bacterium Pla133]QDU99880.1 hypothetical protein Pla86_06190 [Planctomycetes bacterium Pla86]